MLNSTWAVFLLPIMAMMYASAADHFDLASASVLTANPSETETDSHGGVQLGPPVDSAETETSESSLLQTPPATEPEPGSSQLMRDLQDIWDKENAPPTGPAVEDAVSEPVRDRRIGLYPYLKALGALCVVLALILLAYALARRLFKGTPLLAGADLAERMGRIYLDKGVSLHFVRTGGRVLAIGVTPSSVSLVAEFDAAAFEVAEQVKEEKTPTASPGSESFLSHLQEKTRAMTEPPPRETEDDDIASLRDSIRRLQEYLREDATHVKD